LLRVVPFIAGIKKVFEKFFKKRVGGKRGIKAGLMSHNLFGADIYDSRTRLLNCPHHRVAPQRVMLEAQQ